VASDAERRHDRQAFVVAASIAAGAGMTTAGWVPWHLPLFVPVAATALALASRRLVLVCAAVTLLATCLAQRSLEGLTGHDGPEQVHAEVTLTSDPRPTPGGSVQADARLHGKRVALEGHRSSAAALRDRLAGERITVVGELLPPGRYERFVRHRHLAGRLQAEIVVGWRPGHGVTQAANGLRRSIDDGAHSLTERHKSLFAGLLLGDTRDHPADLTESFRASGLAHLLAVSGSNVAYVLVVLAPLTQRLRLAPRLLVTLGALAGFALLTRGEPSVLRATTMAAIAAYSAATGQPMSGLRRLSLALAALLLIDPLLITSLGFRLSAAGTAGIILGARTIADRLPGPSWLTLPVAVTVAAELAVAPLLVTTFGSVPLVSVLANLLATPAAAPLTAWGLTGGLLAGIVGEPVATWLHLPTRVMLVWLDSVASITAGLPVGELHAGHLVALALGGLALVVGARIQRLGVALPLRIGGAGVIVATVTAAALVAPTKGSAPDGLVELGPGMDLWRGGGAAVVVVDGRATEEGLTFALQREHVDRVDLLVIRTPANRAVAVATTLRERWPRLVILAPAEITEQPGDRITGATTPATGAAFQVGTLRLTFEATNDRLEPAISLAEPPTPRPTADARSGSGSGTYNQSRRRRRSAGAVP
jgi:competence protein ComEC